MEKYSLWLWKKPGNSGNFFLLLCGHPDMFIHYTALFFRSSFLTVTCSVVLLVLSVTGRHHLVLLSPKVDAPFT